MEAWLLNKAVLVNGGCEVLVGQCKRSNGGLWFKDYDDFAEEILWMRSHKEECRQMGINGNKYVIENYSWDRIIKKITDFIPYQLKLKKSKV